MTEPGLDRVAAAVLAVLVEASARTVFVVSLAGLTLWLWRRPATSTRSRVWTLVLYAALAMPILARVMPALRFEVPAISAVTTLGNVNASSVPLRDKARAWLGSSLLFEATSAGSGTPGRSGVPWIQLAFAVYVAGVAWLLARMIVGWMIARRLELGGPPITDPRMLDRVARHASRLGLTAPPRLIEHARLFVPIATSVRRPVIGLPADWREWTDRTLDAVLLHEIAHVARADTLTLRLSQIYRACSWINPISWWLHTRLTDLAEQASDEAALESGISRTAYAETLLTFMRRLPGTAERAAWHVAMARPGGGDAERRIDRVLMWDRQMSLAQSRRAQMLATVTIALIVGAAASVRLTAGDLATPIRILPLLVTPVSSPSRGLSLVPLTAPARPAKQDAPGQTANQVSSPTAVTPPIVAAAPANPLPQVPEPLASAFGAGAYRPGDGLKAPVLVHRVTPRYSRAALARNLEGDVELEVVVLADGTVGDLRVSRSLDKLYGLDDEAIGAARQWVFSPALLAGRPVPMLVTLVMEFRVKSAQESPDAAAVPYVPEPLRDAFAKGAYWPGDVGVVAPQVLHAVEPKYTAQAMRDKLQGVVEVEVVVEPDGSVGNVRVLRSIDPVDGLDDNAVEAAKQTTFAPGTLNGQPVSVLVTLELAFRLH
jgi:TonB family protein